MKSEFLYNNVGTCALGIAFVLEHMAEMPISKALLIVPLITHGELLAYLANSRTKAKGLDSILIERCNCFSNFNKRYYDSLCISLNAIQFLNEIRLIGVQNSKLQICGHLEYEKKMGQRLKKIHKASANLAKILKDTPERLYLNLRVEL